MIAGNGPALLIKMDTENFPVNLGQKLIGTHI